MAVKEATLFVSSRNGRYDATLYRVIEDRHLPADTAFECLLSLPDTEYQTAQKMSYQPGTIKSLVDLITCLFIMNAGVQSVLTLVALCMKRTL